MAKKQPETPARPSPSAESGEESESESESESSSGEEESSSTESSGDEQQPPTVNKTNPRSPAPSKKQEEEEEEEEDEDEDEEVGSGDADREGGDVASEEFLPPASNNGKAPAPVPVAAPVKSAAEHESGSESEEESGSESEGESGSESGADSDSDVPKVVTPISSKPLAESAPAPKASDAAAGESSKGAKGSLFRRIWTPEDELKVLIGMVQYQADKGTVNRSAGDEFLDFVKKSMSFEVSKNQLFDKIRKLKKKFMTLAKRVNSGKLAKSGSHDWAVYELGTKIWTKEDEEEQQVTKRTRPTRNVGSSVMRTRPLRNAGPPRNAGSNGVTVKNGNQKRKYPFVEGILANLKCKGEGEEALETIDPGQGQALETMVKKLRVKEYKHLENTEDLQKETLRLIYEGIQRDTN